MINANKVQRAALIALFALLMGIFVYRQSYPPSFKSPHMLPLSPRLATIFQHTKTVCFGNFLVDVPATATVVYGPADVDYDTWYHAGDADKIDEHITERLKKIEKEKRLLGKVERIELSMIGKVIEGAVAGQKLVFGSRDGLSYSIDSFIPVGKDLYIQWADGAWAREEENTIASLNKVASHLRSRAEDEIPTENGLCIEGGFVNFQPEYQRIAVGIRLKEIPDVHFSIEVSKNQHAINESNSLDYRLAGAKKDGGLRYLLIKILRHDKRQIGEWQGTEALARKPAQENNSEAHEFLFFSLGAKNDPLHPSLDIKLDTGVEGNRTAGVKPGVSDEEAIALWDKLTSSIRIRPVNGKKQSAINPPKSPLGELVSTGNICPQTGWWQCSEGGEVVGGKRQFLKQGEPAPHAFIMDAPSLLQKLQGKRPSYKITTVWTLVDYESVVTSTQTQPTSLIDSTKEPDASPPHNEA